MVVEHGWLPFEGDTAAIRQRFGQPLMALAQGQVPALVLRRAFDPGHCEGLMRRFAERGHLYDPSQVGDGRPRRVDIGTSFGTHRSNRDGFFAHARQTRQLFGQLFEGYDHPVGTIYRRLQELVPDKEVKVAREPDGQLYGPAIFRIYHEAMGHSPHYDSARRRSKVFDYAISRFKYQFAGVLCFQKANPAGDSGEPFLYNCPSTPEALQQVAQKRFHQHVDEEGIERVQVGLEPGDLYFFFSENLHEVPAVVGPRPRAVLAIFFAMSPDDDEIFVWS